MKNNVMFMMIIAVLVTGGLGFYAGMQYQKSQRPQFGNGQFGPRGGSGANGAGGRFRNGGGVVGDILSVDKTSVTVKLLDGSSKIVLLTSATSINKAALGTVSDLTVGTRVAAFGMANSDGSVTATNVQINPMMRGPNGSSGSSGALGK